MPIPRILYLADSFLPPGGVQNLSVLSITVLRELERENKLRCDVLVRNGNMPEGIHGSRAYGLGVLMQFKVWWKSLAHRFDYIFSDHLHTARFASRLGAKHVFWAHLIEFDPPLHEIHRHSLNTAHRVVCNSDYTRRRLATLYPEIEHKLRAVQLGDQPREFLAAPLYTQNLSACRLTMIGRMAESERYKGHDQVLEALPFVLRRFPNCKIDMVGGGSDSKRLQEKAKDLGLSESVSFLGQLDDESIFAIIKSSTGLLLPSLREGFGLVYLYAMWAGLPAVALSGTVAEEVLGSCGVYAETQTPEAIVRAIESVLAGAWTFSGESQFRYQKKFAYSAFKGRLSQFILDEAFRAEPSAINR